MHQDTCQHDTCAGIHESGRRYYVSVRNDIGRVGYLLGPYATHQEALDNVSRASELAAKADARAPWYEYGTCSMAETRATVFGR